MVDWTPHLPVLYTHMLWAFPVPVGTATAKVPVSRGVTNRAKLIFGGKADQVTPPPVQGTDGAGRGEGL